MSDPLRDPDNGDRIISGSKGKTTVLRCKRGESADDCAERHKAAGWEVPPGFALGKDANGPKLEWK